MPDVFMNESSKFFEIGSLALLLAFDHMLRDRSPVVSMNRTRHDARRSHRKYSNTRFLTPRWQISRISIGFPRSQARKRGRKCLFSPFDPKISAPIRKYAENQRFDSRSSVDRFSCSAFSRHQSRAVSASPRGAGERISVHYVTRVHFLGSCCRNRIKLSCGSRGETRECAAQRTASLSTPNHALTAHRRRCRGATIVSGEHLNANVIVATRQTEAIPECT